ncbi:hypothetical protein BJ878DRAFT_429628 [Calycina marina]|uniref:Chromatin modification-related protein n=1 Tax=Calycina marina TaxID=1763456 RepID=A0A9P7YVX8_9HELO|nr:hypothetical protein BJ878DRAFT_429628 [Calycina marina]
MPRDDLQIYDGKAPIMPLPVEQFDAAGVIEEYTSNQAANLANEIAFHNDEILAKDNELLKVELAIKAKDGSIQRWIRNNGSHASNPKETQYRKQIDGLYDQAEAIQSQKLALATKCKDIVDNRTQWLDEQIATLTERGELAPDDTLPPLLRPQASQQTRPLPTVTAVPASQTPLSAVATHVRHPNQHPQRPQAQTQGLHLATSGAPASTPTTQSAATILLERQRREASLGPSATSQKRVKLTGGLGTLPALSSGLARPSTTPGTPRAGTPVRAGSAGPRSQKGPTAGQYNKKVAPQGSRQSGNLRKNRPGKSRLNNVKGGTRNKNSPTETNDSELSEAESGASIDEEEPQDEEVSDDKKYCICDSGSYGDMVACDNSKCELEWFHWTCVGLTAAPVGLWLCPICERKAEVKPGR